MVASGRHLPHPSPKQLWQQTIIGMIPILYKAELLYYATTERLHGPLSDRAAMFMFSSLPQHVIKRTWLPQMVTV